MLFLDLPLGSDETLPLPSWYPWEINSVTRYFLTYSLQFVQVSAMMIPTLTNFLFIIYFVFEILIQKSNLCTSLNNIVVYAYWESMSNESAIFQMLSTNSGQNKSYDDLLTEYLQDCIKHHILINSWVFHRGCYNISWPLILWGRLLSNHCEKRLKNETLKKDLAPSHVRKFWAINAKKCFKIWYFYFRDWFFGKW